MDALPNDADQPPGPPALAPHVRSMAGAAPVGCIRLRLSAVCTTRRELAKLVSYAPRAGGFLPMTNAAPGNARRWSGFSTANPASLCQACMVSSAQVPERLVAAK